MQTRIIMIALTTFCLNGCIAGPTPHPATDSNYDPSTSAEMDASMGAVEDNIDGHEANPPNADAVDSVDVVDEDSQGEDADSGEDATMGDSLSGDIVAADAG